MQIKTHIGVSIDGLVTSADGLPAWDWDPGHDGTSPPPGYSDFMDNVHDQRAGGGWSGELVGNQARLALPSATPKVQSSYSLRAIVG
jgi:hypothetical protein